MSSEHHTQILNLVLREDEISWQTMLLDLVEQENMDPWNIDVSVLSKRFLQMLVKMKKMDFRITGKVVLAAALLLKLKSDRLMHEDIQALDNLINHADEVDPYQEMFDGMMPYVEQEPEQEIPKIVPRSPQPRKRKISVYDLVEALEKALEVESRRKDFEEIPEMKAPEKKKDISEVMQEVHTKILGYYKPKGKKSKPKSASLTFTELVPSENKEDKVYTFVPLLHLENAKKVNMIQKQTFSEINIQLLQNI